MWNLLTYLFEVKTPFENNSKTRLAEMKFCCSMKGCATLIEIMYLKFVEISRKQNECNVAYIFSVYLEVISASYFGINIGGKTL